MKIKKIHELEVKDNRVLVRRFVYLADHDKFEYTITNEKLDLTTKFKMKLRNTVYILTQTTTKINSNFPYNGFAVLKTDSPLKLKRALKSNKNFLVSPLPMVNIIEGRPCFRNRQSTLDLKDPDDIIVRFIQSFWGTKFQVFSSYFNTALENPTAYFKHTNLLCRTKSSRQVDNFININGVGPINPIFCTMVKKILSNYPQLDLNPLRAKTQFRVNSTDFIAKNYLRLNNKFGVGYGQANYSRILLYHLVLGPPSSLNASGIIQSTSLPIRKFINTLHNQGIVKRKDMSNVR